MLVLPKTVKMPHILVSGKSVVLLQKGNKLYKHHITGNRDMSEEVGEVVENPKNPDLLGIKIKHRTTGHIFEQMEHKFR